jgi:hypothetical protein
MKHLTERERARNRARAERQKRREIAWLFRQERDRWHYHRGLTRRDQVEVMRRSEPSWRATP